MLTQQEQPVGSAAASGRQMTRRARVRTLIEAVAALYIVFMLTGYAVLKIFQSQFANRMDPYLTEMVVGEFDRASLFWMTYAHAPMYETFLGLIEAVCVVLVFFRRTRPIGALMTLAVMSNVAAMNVYFDISAKFNAVSLAVAALVLVVLFVPTYKHWIDTRETASARFAFDGRTRKIGLTLKTLALVLATVMGVIGLTMVRPLASTGALYGKWIIEGVDGELESENGVAPLAPGSIVMFNRMNVLAVRTGESFHFGRYLEQDSASAIEIWMYQVSRADRHQLPPPGRYEERARALAAYPLGYQLSGSFERLGDERVALRLASGDQPSQVMLRKAPDGVARP